MSRLDLCMLVTKPTDGFNQTLGFEFSGSFNLSAPEF
jgi:hypothetical protein